jgi:hypothetical protein
LEVVELARLRLGWMLLAGAVQVVIALTLLDNFPVVIQVQSLRF